MADSRSGRSRKVATATLLAVGSELTTGDTRDTNGGELARSLAEAGVGVRGILALPDDLELVTAAFRDGLASVDLVVSTGGLGPTPDDLTREALAGAIDEVPVVDPGLEAQLRALYRRRGIDFPVVNLKQAWLIPSATAIPNPNGTAPGWWIELADGRLAALLPGPPREMRPMWHEWVLPRLRERGLGDGRVVRTLRTYGIGESQVAEVLGDALLRRANPLVATYARADWLDVRISAVDERDADGQTIRAGTAIVTDTAAAIRQALEGFVWAEGESSWSDLVAAAASAAGARIAITEVGTGGALGALLADVAALVRSTSGGPGFPGDVAAGRVAAAAREAAAGADAEVGIALAASATGTETRLRVAVAAPGAGVSRTLDLRLFQHGAHGRLRAAVAAAAFAVEVLRDLPRARPET